MKVEVGALVSIPLDDSYVVCKILYVSNYFKNIALFKVIPTRIPLNKGYSELLSSSNFELFYTGTSLIKNGKWPVIGSAPLSNSEMGASKRIVGGDVWESDECLGPASDKDIEIIPKMKGFNVKYIEEKASKYPVQNGI